MKPWLSVLMPVYNGGRYLAAALESVVAQHDPEVEVIAVDDGSTDDSVQILKSFASHLPLTIVREGRSGNWVRATNRALQSATGEFIGFLHQDDLWLPGRIALLRRLASEHPQAAMLFHAANFIDPAGRDLGRWRSPLRTGEYAQPTIVKKLLVQNFIAIPTPIVRRDVAVALGGLDERFWYTPDWDFWLKLVAAHPANYYDEPFAAFRLHAESQTVTRSDREDDFRRQMLDVYEAHASPMADVDRVARFSIDVNTALAQLAHGGKPPLASLAWRFLHLGPSGWRRYLRDSRIIERAGSRIRLKLRGAGGSSTRRGRIT